MGQLFKDAWKNDIWLKILSVITIIMFIAGFIVPPMGVIDGSVLIAGSEISFFGVLFEVSKAISKGSSISVTHKDTSIDVGDQKEN